VAAAIASSLAALLGVATVAAGDLDYVAVLGAPAAQQGALDAGGIRWVCKASLCATRGPWPVPDVKSCGALARLVGAVRSYGYKGRMLSPADVALCNKLGGADGRAIAERAIAEPSGKAAGAGPPSLAPGAGGLAPLGAVPQPRTLDYLAILAGQGRIQGNVAAGSLRWSCKGEVCRARAPGARPDVKECGALAQRVGPVRSFGSRDMPLSDAEVALCNRLGGTQMAAGAPAGGDAPKPMAGSASTSRKLAAAPPPSSTELPAGSLPRPALQLQRPMLLGRIAGAQIGFGPGADEPLAEEAFGSRRAEPGAVQPAPADAAAAALSGAGLAPVLSHDLPLGTWVGIGPRPIVSYPEIPPAERDDGLPYSGAVNAIVTDPSNPTIAYIGAAGGGIWKTTDDGRSWVPLAQHLPSLQVQSIAISARDPRTLLVGLDVPDPQGVALYRTDDGGRDWRPVGGTTFAGGTVYAVMLDPADDRAILALARTPDSAATIYRSEDGGASWASQSLGAAGSQVDRVQPDPADAAVRWLTVTGFPSGRLLRSADAGRTWSDFQAPGLPDRLGPQPLLAFAPGSPRVRYVAATNPVRVFVSYDAGTSWAAEGAPTTRDGNPLRNASVLAVDPADPGSIFIAWNMAYVSRDAGATFGAPVGGSQGTGIHMDFRAAHVDSRNRLWLASDGGIYRTSHFGPPYQNLNATLAISLLYSIDIVGRSLCAGSQDNGIVTWLQGTTWGTTGGGDAGDCIIDRASPEQIFVSGIGDIIVSKDGNRTFARWSEGIDWQEPHGMLVPLARGAGGRVLAGTARIWQSGAGTRRWSAVSPRLAEGSEYVVALGSSQGRAYALLSDGHLAAGPEDVHDWSSVAVAAGRMTYMGQIAASPANGKSAVVAGLAGLWRTSDGGSSWQDIAGTLASRNPTAVAVDWDPSGASPRTIYVGTMAGVFASRDLGRSWEPMARGLPNAVVTQLLIMGQGADRALYAATFGRSAFATRIGE
jgi:photosystem II stability/assembly factor-like uncharacterized protein